MRQQLLNNLKNIPGWRTNRKIIVFAVDDYGNVRLDSRKALEALTQQGLRSRSRFDEYDTLETRQDLEQLYEVLTSVKDKHGNPAVFTPFALPANINFEAMRQDGYNKYIYEPLPETYQKLEQQQPSAYSGAWQLWQEGMAAGLMQPQFHGREHLNLKVFHEKLQSRDPGLMTVLSQRSFSHLSSSGYPTISYTAAFDFVQFRENEAFKMIIEDGLQQFEQVFGYKAVHFNAPGGRESRAIHPFLKENGIRYIDTPMLKKEHLGKGRYKRVFTYTGKKNRLGQLFLVRNVVFEPTHKRGLDWVSYTLRQIEAAFRWHKPAIVSSHRVNFCGHIDPKNRETGLTALQELLTKIITKWPDVEFMSSAQLGELIARSC